MASPRRNRRLARSVRDMSLPPRPFVGITTPDQAGSAQLHVVVARRTSPGARATRPVPGDAAGGQCDRVRPLGLGFDADAGRGRMDDERADRRRGHHRQDEVGPRHDDRRADRRVDVVEATLAERGPGPEIGVPVDRHEATGGDEVGRRIERVGGVDADRHVALIGSPEPRVPAESGGHRQLDPAATSAVNSSDPAREADRLADDAAEGPAEWTEVHLEAHRSSVGRGDPPRPIEDEPVDRVGPVVGAQRMARAIPVESGRRRCGPAHGAMRNEPQRMPRSTDEGGTRSRSRPPTTSEASRPPASTSTVRRTSAPSRTTVDPDPPVPAISRSSAGRRRSRPASRRRSA